MKLTKKSCAEFVDAVATKSPVPGGGGASAMCGAIGAALANMVGCLTVGKKKYAAVEPEIKACMEKCSALQSELLALVEKDAEAFAPLAAAYALPKETEQQRSHKAEAMEAALYEASLAPLEIMKKCCEAIDLAAIFAEKGSVMALSDAGVGAAICRAALEGAALNVYINTKGMSNRERAASLNAEANALLQAGCAVAAQVYRDVSGNLTE